MTGNRCGHDRARPRLSLPAAPPVRGRFPYLIATAIERAEGLYTDRSLFPELGERKRSERIEAMVLVAKCLLRNTDRLTLRSGRRLSDGSFAGISVQTIAKWAGLELTRGRPGKLVPQRAYRAIWDLRDAGWLRCSQPIERLADGSRRGLAGIRQWARRFFDRLRLGGRLRRERRELYETQRQTHQATIAEARRLRRLHRASDRAAQLTRRTVRQLAASHAAPPAALDEDARKAEIARQLEDWAARQPKPPPRG